MKWHAWDVEYPDEGSIIVEADTYERAREKAGVQLDIDNEFVGLSPDTDTERARIRREVWAEAARICEDHQRSMAEQMEKAPERNVNLWLMRVTTSEYLAGEFRRRAEEEGRG